MLSVLRVLGPDLDVDTYPGKLPRDALLPEWRRDATSASHPVSQRDGQGLLLFSPNAAGKEPWVLENTGRQLFKNTVHFAFPRASGSRAVRICRCLADPFLTPSVCALKPCWEDYLRGKQLFRLFPLRK